MGELLKYVDKLFESYNYQLASNSTNKVRIYTLRYGMYHAAEIISFDESTEVLQYKNELSDLGYATELKVVRNIGEIEEYLFEGFFIKTPLGSELKKRYKYFVSRQLQNLPEGSKYEYINSSYDFIYQNKIGELEQVKTYDSKDELNLINNINNLINNTPGALFIIIEAPAGFGKTCTANEILNTFSPVDCKKLPFFTELSRNREARVFKHILLNEIDEQFPNGIKQNIVLEQIYKGRIPLIIDGFDELISKESNKEEVESMLATIVDLLKDDAKIIITSRKTALFNSNEFFNTVYDSIQDFSLARFEIKEPTVENWLNPDRLEIIEKNNFPINQIANPVLLSYLRNISLNKLNNYISLGDGALIDKYFEYLLKREQVRQNLKLDNQTQFRIFRKLNRLMSEFNITAESKDTIKEFIKEYNLNILQDSLKEYSSEERPTIEDLVDTLSNHVLLDRKANGNVGFVNDFVFGFLIGENLILNKFQEHYQLFTKVVPQDFAIKSIDSFKIQSFEKREKLWNVYNNNSFNYDIEFYLDLDYNLTNDIKRDYNNLFLTDRTLKYLNFTSKHKIKNSIFSSVIFENCTFDLSAFSDCSFQNCKFYDCKILNHKDSVRYENFGLYACTDNDDFINLINSSYSNEDELIVNEKCEMLTEEIVLQQFLQIDSKRPKPRKFSYIKKNLSNYSDREISKVIDSLKRKEFIHFKDDVGFITREAMNYLNHINN